jgi:transcriptional antiterminator NusG
MTARWYIVHAYSNFEKKVAEDIENKAKQKGLSDRIEQVVVPTEKVVEVRRGKKVDAERKFFPGYVLLKANLNDQVISLVKNTPRVTGFLGEDKHTAKPMPITEKEAERILNQVQEGVERPKPSITFEIGEQGAPCPSIWSSVRSKRADCPRRLPGRRIAGGRRRWLSRLPEPHHRTATAGLFSKREPARE